MDQCSSCRFYHEIKPSTASSLGSGECRQRSPVVPSGSHDRFHPDFAIFPVVLENDWCGEIETRAPRVAQRRVDQANEAFDAASQQDAPDAAVMAHCGECDHRPESSPTGAA